MLLDQIVTLGAFQVFPHHLGHQFVERGFGRPSELYFRLGGIAKQGFHFSRAEVARINPHQGVAVLVNAGLAHTRTLPRDLYAQFRRRDFDKLAHAVLHAGGDDEIFRRILLQHQPLRFDVVAGMAPIAQGRKIAQIHAVLQTELDARQRAGDLAGDKGFAPHRRFMVEQNTVAGIDAIGLAVVDGDPVGVQLGDGVGAARIKRCRFGLWRLLHQPIQLGTGGLVEARLFLQPKQANRFEYPQRANAVRVGSVFGRVKTDRHMAHCSQVIDLVRLHLLNDANQIGGVGQIAMVQNKTTAGAMRVFIQMVDPLRVEKR